MIQKLKRKYRHLIEKEVAVRDLHEYEELFPDEFKIELRKADKWSGNRL
jgi:hypothetical protein